MSLFLNLLFETDSYSNAYLLAKFGFDTAENEPFLMIYPVSAPHRTEIEPCKVCPLSAYRLLLLLLLQIPQVHDEALTGSAEFSTDLLPPIAFGAAPAAQRALAKE